MTRLLVLSTLGYFVDILDLFLFNVLRLPSLRALGVPADRLFASGVLILNCQMGGLLVGSFIWGVLGDRLGRVRVLYGSIVVYSLATLANAAVNGVGAYAACRFLAGLGLAGELGAAITLVSESMSKEKRGYGTALVAGVGLFGGVLASILAEWLPWRQCYLVGGFAGLLLLVLRFRLVDARVYLEIQHRVDRGDLRLLFATPSRLARYAQLVLIGVPVYYVSGLLMVFAPELAKAIGVAGEVTAAKAILYSYLSTTAGDVASGLISQWLKNRRQTVAIFLGAVAIAIVLYFNTRGATPAYFYFVCFVLGLTVGYWAMLITMAAESFGTNLRATVTTTVPNLIRASTIPLTFAFQAISARTSMPTAAASLGVIALLLAGFSLSRLPETFGRDLSFVEE